MVVFTFHRVTADSRSGSFYLGYDRGVGVAAFEEQVEGIRRYFEIASHDQFLRVLRGEEKPRTHTALLTFDDADSEFLTSALPVLERHGCPSVVFAPTGFVDTDERFWHLRLSNLLHEVGPEGWREIKAHVTQWAGKIAPLVAVSSVATDLDRAATCQRLVAALDELADSEIAGILAAWEDSAGVDYRLGIKCMTWHELRDLIKRNVSVQSHTVTHRKLARLEPAEIERELLESKARLEAELGTAVKSICYPAGSFNEEVIQAAERCGYEAGFTTRPGTIRLPEAADQRCALRRLNMQGLDEYQVSWFLGSVAVKAGIFGRL